MTAKSLKSLLAATVGLTLISAQPAFSQNSNSDVIRSFEPAYFNQYAPRTALDMVERVPGFQLDGGDTKRGLGQGGANVLLNGQRLTGKSGDPFNQLGRISSENVIRIEILDGASLNIPGLSGQVANVVAKSNKKMSGSWEWRPEWRESLQADLLDFSATISGETGNLSYTAEIQNDSFRNGHFGPEIRTDATGNVFEIRDESGLYNGDNPGGSLNLTWKPKEDHIGNLNLEYNRFNFNDTSRSFHTAITPRGDNDQTLFNFAEDEWNAKIDGDYEFPFIDGKLKLIGYYRAESSPTEARFRVWGNTGLTESIRFAQEADEGEAIGRAEYSWSKREGRDWQLGVEGVYNFLDTENEFTDLINPGPREVDMTEVEELRGEATLTHSRTLSPKWDAQISVGAEYSELSSQGSFWSEIDGMSVSPKQSDQFFRPKGFISATYKPKDNLNIRMKIEREVGQLNFFDFVNRVDLVNNFDTAGNPNLVPNQSWLGELEFDRQFSGGHTFKARFYGELISDLVDRIPIGTDGDAIGNIDSAKRYGVDMNATIKGDPFGLKGMQLDLELDGRDSSVDDPLEGFSRRLNGDKMYYWNASLRYDVPNTDWAFGGFIEDFRQSPAYRLNTVNQYRFEGPWAHVFVEHKDVFGLKVNASFRNLFDASDDFQRIVYTARRDQGVIDQDRSRSRRFGHFLRLNISGKF